MRLGLSIAILAACQAVAFASGARAHESDRAIRDLAPFAELLVITAPGCEACPDQARLAQTVAARYGYRVSVVSIQEISARTVPAPVVALLEPLRPVLREKAPVVYVAVPAIPALLPLVSSQSMPRTADELVDRLAIVAELGATSPGR